MCICDYVYFRGDYVYFRGDYVYFRGDAVERECPKATFRCLVWLVG